MGIAYLGGVLMLPLLFAYLSGIRWYGLFIPVAFAVLLAVFLTLAYASQPVAYRLDDDTLVVKRRWLRAVRIPYQNITSVAPSTSLADIPWRRLRFAFNPGVFGYQGPFHLDPYGKVFFLATNRERLVAVARLSMLPIILSPANPRAFAEALTKKHTAGADQHQI